MKMAEALYLKDCYLKEFGAAVSKADGKFVVLDRTAFYPKSGGQPHDTGKMVRESDGKEFKVVFCGKFSGEISHEVDQEGLQAGDKVKCKIDWDRRYLFMRYHTASHVLAAIIEQETGALITGNQIGEDKTRIDFSLDEMDRDQMMATEAKVNDIAEKGLPLKFYFMPRDEAEKNPKITKLAMGLPPAVKELRIVEIEGFDVNACGGTHLANTKEIGRIRIVELVNKGKNNRRIYFTIV
jgi:misacylated tRNA(Ala) deacylase